jgi:eukaryotic-like serine/threonine-protein kinase
MNNPKALLDDTPWSPSVALHVEQVCNRFEAAWKAGQRPRIGHYLGHTPEPERSVLLGELLGLEVEYRRKSGEGVLPEEYCRQFSEHAGLIHELLAEVPSGDARGATPAAGAATDTTPPAAAAGNEPVPAVPGYEVLGELGRGGMGVVYRARHVRLERLVALKMILSGAHAEETELARFRIEAEAVARLQHPNIVQIHEVGDYNHLPYLSLEFVDGGGLDRQLAGTPQDPRAAASLLETVARAMHFAHKKGIVHRDLKPANVLLTREGTPKVTDFGLAKRLDRDRGATQSGAVVGTPSYMAPEQAAGKIKEVGPPADVYALGAILYEALTGRPPFKDTTPLGTLQQVISQEPVAPRRLQPAVPRDLETVCLKCLAKEAQHRYGSALALAEDLHRFLAGEPIQARPAPALARAGRWLWRRPALAALLAFGVLAPFALLAVLLWHNRDLTREVDETRRSAALSQRQADGEALLRKAQAAWAAGDLQSAKLHAEEAVEKTSSEASLAGLRAEAERQRDEAQQLLDQLAGRTQARARFDDFLKKRDAALFDAALLDTSQLITGQDPSANVQATRTAARQALELFAARAGGPAPDLADWTLDTGPAEWFSAPERADIAAGCYGLLLILARMVAQPLEGEDSFRQAGAALRLLDRAAQLRPPTRALHLCRAACLTRQNDTAAAARETAAAQRLEPADAIDYFLLGSECAHRKELPQAVDHFKNTLRLQPESFWAHYYLAVCSLQLQRPDQAELSLTVCQSRGPDRVWVYLLRGYANGQLGERALRNRWADQAAPYFAAAAADFRQAQTLLDRQPDREAAYTLRVNRAATLILQAKYPDAQKDLEEALRLKPNQFNAYLLLAEVYTDRQDHDAALAQLDRAIDLQPRLAVLSYKRGQIQRTRGDLPAALGDFTRAVELLEGARLSATETEVLADAHAARGKILYSQKHYAEALQAFDAARTIRPDWPQLQRWRGGVLQEQGRYAEALQAYDDYLLRERQPAGVVYEARGLIRLKSQDYAGAVADFDRALEVAPGTASVHGYRGWTYLVSGSPGLALQDFEEAVRLDERNGDAHVGRGYALVQLGRLKDGVAAVQQGLRLGPESPRLLWNAAQAYAQATAKLGAVPGTGSRLDLQARWAYQEQAVELLRQAVLLEAPEKRTTFWREDIQDNAALAPIRSHRGFARLAAEYAAKPR